MTDEKIKRINELAKKKKEVGQTRYGLIPLQRPPGRKSSDE